jgi:O-antigen/teichoic acid export membrane protein
MENPSLVKKSLHAIKWNYIGVASMVLLQFFVVVFLARKLGPAAFGFLSIAIIVTGIGNIFVGFGIGEALIQRNKITKNDISSAFTLLILFGFAAFCTTFMFSDSIASAFNSENYAAPIKTVSITFIFHSLSVVSRSILRRNMDFKYIQIVQLSSYFIGFFLVGVLSAINGLGEWSFAYALLSQSMVASTLLYIRVRHSIVLKLHKGAYELLEFGSKIVKTNLLNWVIENLDNVLVGKFFGSTQLGLYSVTYNLVRTPINHLIVSLQSVMLPLVSRIQNKDDQLVSLFYAFISIMSILTFPVFLSVSSLSEVVLDALYGSEWVQVSEILVPISLAMPLHAIMAITGPFLWGMGRVEKELKIQLFVAIFFTISMLVACQISLTVAAWTVFSVYAIRAIMMIYILSTVLKIERIRVLDNIKGGVILGALVSSTLAILNTFLVHLEFSPLYRLLLIILSGAISLFIYSYYLKSFIITKDLTYLLRIISNNSSDRISQLIEKHLLESR